MLRRADSARSQATDRTILYQLRSPRPAVRQPAAAPAARPDQRVPVNPVPRDTLRQCGAGPHPLSRHADDPRPQINRDTRSRDPPAEAVALLAARGARAIRRTMPPAPARPIRA